MRTPWKSAVSVSVLLVVSGCDFLDALFAPRTTDDNASCESSVLGCPTAAGMDFSNPFFPRIAGISLTCFSAFTGQQVATYADPSLNDMGRAAPGVPPTILVNPVALASWPRKMQLYLYGHECGHHVLGHTLGLQSFASESQADCWSIQTAKAQGLVTRSEVVAFEPYLRNNPGSPWGHLPGPQRAALLVQCFDQG
jgi:hypothetical protein